MTRNGYDSKLIRNQSFENKKKGNKMTREKKTKLTF